MIAKFKDIKTLDEFAKLDLKWLVDGFIKEQTITQLFGQSGGGKTTLSLALAKYALDNKSIKQVIYIDCDNSLASLNDNNVRDFIEKYKNLDKTLLNTILGLSSGDIDINELDQETFQ